ncbi:MAG TPA: PadR family transcriptional regulator [Chthoniobacterales bacterium]|nr:PadR family transcriptional regulator [Chthoniobacterales bacterium]
MKAEFFILGILHRGDFHPYEIKRRLNNAMVECYTDIDVGTLYYAVRQLVNSGDITPKTKQKVTRGGERTIYRITSQGRKRFQELLLGRFQEEGMVAQTVYPALLFLDLADLPAVAELLSERLRQTESALAKTSAIKKQLGAGLGSGNTHLIDHLIQIRRIDCRSLRRLLREVETGRIRAPQPRAIKQLGSLSIRVKQRS